MHMDNWSCEGSSDEQVTTCALRGTHNIDEHTCTCGQRGEHKGGGIKKAYILYRDQRVSWLIKPKGSSWRAVQRSKCQTENSRVSQIEG